LLVLLTGLLGLGFLAYRTYAAQPPIPRRVVAEDGRVVFTETDVREGQRLFLRYGLMEYGSIFGHGAYLGPDFTADTLRRSALSTKTYYELHGDPNAGEHTANDFKRNRYDADTGDLVFTAAQGSGFTDTEAHYGVYFAAPATETGLRLQALLQPQDVHALTSFFAWTAWVASATRPDKNYSYTNNWPPEPLVGNHPTASAIVFSMLSLATLLGGTGLLLGVFGRWRELGWQWRAHARIAFRRPADVQLTPSQRACAWFFFVMGALFLVQVLVGAASQHYRADVSNFFGFDLSRWLPYNLVRTWHVQLSIPEARWSDRAAKFSFWSLNIGLAWMVFATLFPLGILQLYESIEHGYYEARALSFLTNPTNRLLEWLRLPGDIVFIAGGVLPLLWICWCGVRYRVPFVADPESRASFLFTEVTEASVPEDAS